MRHTVATIAHDPSALFDAISECQEMALNAGATNRASDFRALLTRLESTWVAYRTEWRDAFLALLTCDQCAEVYESVEEDEDHVRLCPACRVGLEADVKEEDYDE